MAMGKLQGIINISILKGLEQEPTVSLQGIHFCLKIF